MAALATAASLAWTVAAAGPAGAQARPQVRVQPEAGPPGTSVRISNPTGAGCPALTSSGEVGVDVEAVSRTAPHFYLVPVASGTAQNGILGGDWATQLTVPP